MGLMCCWLRRRFFSKRTTKAKLARTGSLRSPAGIGIAPGHQAGTFDEFAWVRHGKANRRLGSALGLAFGRGIGEAHGVDIVVNMAPSQGSAF